MKRGHGKFQGLKFKTGSFTFQQQGIKKKFAKISLGQLRVRFPQYAHLSETEMREAIKRDLEQ